MPRLPYVTFFVLPFPLLELLYGLLGAAHSVWLEQRVLRPRHRLCWALQLSAAPVARRWGLAKVTVRVRSPPGGRATLWFPWRWLASSSWGSCAAVLWLQRHGLWRGMLARDEK